MKRIALTLLVACLGSGCSVFVDEDADSADKRPQVMYAPELSHPRECKLTSEPPPPIRNPLQTTSFELITQAEPAAIQTTTTLQVKPERAP